MKSAKYGTDDKGDVVINGVRVDVKSTKYLNGKLIAAKWKNPNNVDAFALMVGEFPEYKYCGAIPANELLKDERLKNLKHGDTYVAVQEELVDSLWEEASV